jgi:hypothetical protein
MYNISWPHLSAHLVNGVYQFNHGYESGGGTAIKPVPPQILQEVLYFK